jgi:hypothetical protein
LTVPSTISGANIHSDVMAIPAFANTAARKPSAALTCSWPRKVTVSSTPSRLKGQTAPPPLCP